MSDNCNNDCASCGDNGCADRTTSEKKKSLLEQAHPQSHVKKIIGVLSGKGGVGKSMVTASLAVAMHRKGLNVGVLDSDITGPSIPKAFGITSKATGGEDGIFPVKSQGGIDVMSMNLLLENETDPVLWRGPLIAGAVKQFWTDVIWENEDFLFVDMPPGTGDVAMTVFQSFPIDGIIVVTSPQELVTMIVDKAVNMANMMHIPIIGIVENMSFITCPHCDEKINVFGESHIDDVAKTNGLKVLAKVPLDPKVAELMDAGKIESFEGNFFDSAIDEILK